MSHHVKKLSFYETLDVRYLVHKGPTRGWDSVVGIMSRYCLGIDCRWGEILSTRRPVKWVADLFPGGKASGVWR